MADTESAGGQQLARELRERWWIDNVEADLQTGDDDGGGMIGEAVDIDEEDVSGVDSATEKRVEGAQIQVETSEVPDLRDVYDLIEDVGVGRGVVTVGAPGQEWEIEYADRAVESVERTGGRYTIMQMSLLERFFHGINFLGVYLIFAGITTAIASFVVSTTPMSLFGMTPLAGAGWLFGVGLAMMIGGSVMFNVVPGMSEGATTGEPGEGIDGFDQLPDRDRAALIAEDDAKSRRNASLLMKRQRTLGIIGMFAFASYVGLIGYMNAGALGVLVAGGLFALKTVGRLLLTLLLYAAFDPIDDEYVAELHREIRADADGTTRPTVLAYGDEDNPIHENVAMAIPELDAILVPLADVEKLHRDELKSILAHEYKHVESHYPMVIALVKAALLLVPGIALFVVDISPTLLQLGVGLFVYFAAVNAVVAIIQRGWEHEADAFAEEVASPTGLAFGLTRVTDQHIIDADNQSLLSGSTGELYGSHPFPHRRITKLIKDASE